MNLSARAPFRSFLSCALLACVAGCSGGGGGGSSGSSIGGTISMLFGSGGPILEAEPNDTVSQVHALGNILAGQTIVVVGQVSGTDVVDGFKVVAPVRVKITATLAFDNANDFDLVIYDEIAGDFVEEFVSLVQPEVGVFHAQGAFLPVVGRFSGSGTYTLTLSASAPADPILEVELNDVPGEAQYLGTLLDGQVLQLSGSANAATDATDRFLIGIPADTDVGASLDFPLAGANFDVIYSDVTVDLLAPVLITSFNSLVNNPETGTASILALTMLEVTVQATTGSGSWILTLDATASDDFAASPRDWRNAPVAHELRQRFARSSMPRFGEPVIESVPGEILVMPRPGRDVTRELARRGLALQQRIPGGAMKCLSTAQVGATVEEARRHTQSLVASFAVCDDVLYAEPNYICRTLGNAPNDPFFNLQWHYDQLQLNAAWGITQGDNAVRVGVLDTGRTNHPDLAGRQITGFDFISNATIAGDNNGVDIDETDVGDSQGVGPSSFHGTHVAGTIGANTDNGIGVAGVTWFGQIMHLRVLGIGGGSVFDIANAVRHSAGLTSTAQPLIPVLAAPLDIINMSLGGPGFSQTFQDACTAAHTAGVVIFAAAGNENSTTPSFPAAFTNVVSIAAVDFNADRAPYSNRHPTVDLAAPGGDTTADLNGDGFADGVLSTVADDSASPTTFNFAFFQGTSMATPHAAGVAALMLAVNPNLTPDEVETLLKSTATDLGAPGDDDSFGSGLINAFQAVAQAGTPPSTPPVLGLSAQSLGFGPSTTTLNVQVANLGGGVLSVGNPVATTDSGGNWLSATRVPVAPPVTTDTSALIVSVDRGGLADGTFTGSILVPSNGGNLTIQVVLQVDSTPAPPNVDIFVVAVDAATGLSVRQDIVNPTSSLVYFVPSLPAGTYFIYAGSDDDDDQIIGEPEDQFFGAFPTPEQPVAITVAANEAVPAIDFAVQTNFQGSASASGSSSKKKLVLLPR